MPQSLLLVVAVAALIVCPIATDHSVAGTPDEITARLSTEVDALDGASASLKTFIKETLIPHCTNPVFVSSVAAQNAKGVSLQGIQEVDTQWIEAEDELAIHKELMSNACAQEIGKIAKEHSAVGETFVMDNQGANVGQNELTSDYWQGDEPKWQDSFKDGQGAVALSKPKLDKSTGEVDQKVSLPIIDDNGNVIGVVCFGLNPNDL